MKTIITSLNLGCVMSMLVATDVLRCFLPSLLCTCDCTYVIFMSHQQTMHRHSSLQSFVTCSIKYRKCLVCKSKRPNLTADYYT